MIERIAACRCRKVCLSARGEPIVCAICYCPDCQAGGRLLESHGASNDFRDAWDGMPYATYRNDRLQVVEGQSLIEGVKLRPDAPTTRYMTTCCNSAMYLKYGPGWWSSIYRSRLGDAAPQIQMRNKVAHAKNRATLPADVPTYESFPPTLFAKLLLAGVGTLLRL